MRTVEEYLQFWFQAFVIHAVIMDNLWKQGVVFYEDMDCASIRVDQQIIQHVANNSQFPVEYWKEQAERITADMNAVMTEFLNSQGPVIPHPWITESAPPPIDELKPEEATDLFSQIQRYLRS